MTPPLETWLRANMALTLLCIDPAGLGGMWLRARCGPARDCLTAGFSALPLTVRRIHPAITDDALFGGLDLTATLSSGHFVRTAGLMQPNAALVLTMAERCDPSLAVKLARGLDHGTCGGLVAVDEGVDYDERAPETLTDRLAFHIDLESVSATLAEPSDPDPMAIDTARRRLGAVSFDPVNISDLTHLAASFGIDSPRAILFAMKAARAHAAFFGRECVGVDDIKAAVELVFAARAVVLPPQDHDDPPDLPEEDKTQDMPQSQDTLAQIPQDMLIETIKAAMPDGVVDALSKKNAAQTAGQKGQGAGTERRGNRRGRPLPARQSKYDSRARIDLLATLRAAAPWQTIRRLSADHRIEVRPSDLRTKQYKQHSDRLIIFAVDASGSSAVSRLNEAKGAVELLLAQSYAMRDHVGLIAFRGEQAEVLLHPTRSLVQAKRQLAALPGGGGTPLAAGLKAAMQMSDEATRRGLTPAIAMLTDGRANIALDGSPNRKAAAEDAETIAKRICATGTPSVVIDTANRPQPPLKHLAQTMNGTYFALPRADARRLSAAISGALDA
ncbi:magnesium chelatase subunit D [Pseudaestuariivita rosea]|uniref:magnesium chelatase subunit D n=1 Tax=Pseudaestuariivita rosea TaxID=2763263 RepID=UPI001ABA9B6A|nr:magnesium chelatase subunit D [Pseudaestuariivita rosea]